jgi:uncharacterized repeat protein (TIGR03837 family)
MHFPDLDIFCTVVDNYGDIGFSYRLARTYKTRHPLASVRLFVDKPETLAKIQILGTEVDINGYSFSSVPEAMAPLIIETFGCNIPCSYNEIIKRDTKLWINIEYLSAEDWTKDCHGKESPQGIPGLKKIFYMPGFTSGTGGVITDFNKTSSVPNTTNTNNVSIFTYEQDYSLLLNTLFPSTLLIFDTQAQDILRPQIKKYPQHSFEFRDFVSQNNYDQVLVDCKLNLVRGEESLIRAILAGKPFLWQAYPQEHAQQLVKVQALLKTMEPFFKNKHIFQEYAKLMLAWNGDNKPVAVDNWRFLLENLPAVGLSTQAFGQHLRQNCDMGLLFDQFITQNW